MGGAGLLMDQQRVHVGAQADRTAFAATLDDADHAGAGDAGDHLVDPEFPQLCLHDPAGADLLQRQFRMAVQVVAPFRHFGVKFGDAVDDRHGGVLRRERQERLEQRRCGRARHRAASA
jgi:hypothetical protein